MLDGMIRLSHWYVLQSCTEHPNHMPSLREALLPLRAAETIANMSPAVSIGPR
jgi:hypothetical protein